MLIFVLIEVTSCGLAYFHQRLLPYEVNLIWTSYILLPIIIATFVAQYRIWAEQDYNCYHS